MATACSFSIDRTNLHKELMQRLGAETVESFNSLSAIAYRVVERATQPQLDIWQHSLCVGEALPTLPLWLRGELCLPVDLERTYDRTCREQRIHLDRA